MWPSVQCFSRVIRGPDWCYKNQDGGKGHAGTVLRLHDVRHPHPHFPRDTVQVQWDNGDKGLYRVGLNHAFDLRFIEVPKPGRHLKIWCEGCNTDEIKGIRWRCTECYAIDLCTTCYMNNKHNTSHVFMRVMSSHKTSKGPKMLPRSSSSRIPLSGSFPGGEVVRYPQWYKRMGTETQDVGKVVKDGQTPKDGAKRAVVEFPAAAERVCYTDISCTLPGSGGYVYPGHLPNLGDPEPVSEGDKVLVIASPAELEELHKRRGLWELNMLKTSGRKGFVNKRTDSGDFKVTLEDSQETFTMNSAALRKIHPLCLGQLVRISDDIEMFKRLQFGHGGWKSSMSETIGKVGNIVKIDGLDMHVKTKYHTFIYNSANLTPARIPYPPPKDETMEESLLNVAHLMTQPEAPLMFAVASGDVATAERILKKHPKWVNHEPSHGRSLLGGANENVDMMKLLVKKGAHIESYDDEGTTPLMMATTSNNFEGVQFLLEQGADVDAANYMGMTSLSIACIKGHFQCAHFLLLHGADVNLKAKDDCTPLIRAIEHEGRTILDLLLARKELDLKAVSLGVYMSAMHYAALGGNTYALTKLIDKAPRMVDATQCNGNTPIFLAGYDGYLKATELLIKKGKCNVNAQTYGERTSPLSQAISKMHFHMVDVLVKNGADVNLANHAGNTCLQIAVDVLNDMDTDGIVIDEEPYMKEMMKKWGHIGIKTCSDAILAFLISYGGDLEAFNREGITVRESMQLMPSKEPILAALDEIRTLKRKDITGQQSTASQPLRNLTKKATGAAKKTNGPGKKACGQCRKPCGPGNGPHGPEFDLVYSMCMDFAARAEKQCQRNCSGTSASSSVSQRKSPGKEPKNVRQNKAAGDCAAPEPKEKTSDTAEYRRLQAELQRKDNELKTLRSKVQTLEHLVKKKISFACGHDVIRSIAEIIPECPNCSEPIACVVDI